MKYRVHKIEQNYNQIWHRKKTNKNIVVNYNFTVVNEIHVIEFDHLKNMKSLHVKKFEYRKTRQPNQQM